MNWTVELVKAKHWIGYDRQTAYYDSLSNITVPMFDQLEEGLTSRAIMGMEEQSMGSEGTILLDTTSNKLGYLIRKG